MIIEETIILRNPKGIHARPAAMIVKLAKQSPSTITLTCRDKTADAHNMMAVLMLAAAKGDRITIRVESDQPEELTDTLNVFTKLLTSDFSDD